MYAVVKTGGKQYRVSAGATLVVDHFDAEAGSQITLNEVLLVGGETVQVGAPTVPGATVTATVVSHAKGEKTEYTRYLHRRRTRRTKNGRASLSVLQINAINV